MSLYVAYLQMTCIPKNEHKTHYLLFIVMPNSHNDENACEANYESCTRKQERILLHSVIIEMMTATISNLDQFKWYCSQERGRRHLQIWQCPDCS